MLGCDEVYNICKPLCGHMSLFLLGKYLRVDVLGAMVNACVAYKSYNLFSKEVVPLGIYQRCEGSSCSTPSPALALPLILMVAMRVGALRKCYEPGTGIQKTQFIPSRVDIFMGEENTSTSHYRSW